MKSGVEAGNLYRLNIASARCEIGLQVALCHHADLLAPVESVLAMAPSTERVLEPFATSTN